MTIFVDELIKHPLEYIKPKAQKFGEYWSHMWTDGEDLEELHEFAGKIGLKRFWFQNKRQFPHYDIVPSKRKLAIENGAKEILLIDWFRFKNKKREI